MVILEKCIYGMVNNLSFCRESDKIIARPLFLFTFHSYIKYNANNVTFKPHECFVEIGNYGKKKKRKCQRIPVRKYSAGRVYFVRERINKYVKY